MGFGKRRRGLLVGVYDRDWLALGTVAGVGLEAVLPEFSILLKTTFSRSGAVSDLARSTAASMGEIG